MKTSQGQEYKKFVREEKEIKEQLQEGFKEKDPIIFDAITHKDKARLGETWPIMSTSKAFCGALIVANAHQYFGDKGVKSTVREALEFAKTQNPDRAENINALIISLEKSGSADLEIAKILNHTAGLNNNNAAYAQTPKYEAKDQNSYFAEMEVSKKDGFSYSNNGYYLLEQLVNLTSESGNYHHEMTEKILRPLELSQTKFLSEATKEERQRVGDGGFVMPYPHSFAIGKYEETCPIRNLSAAAGGLMSSGRDTEIFFKEYVKMMLGENNAITKSPNLEIANLYREMLVSVREGSNEYFSLATTITQKDQYLLVGHDGGHASNSCHARVKINGTIQEFREGLLGEDRISAFEFDVNKFSAIAGMLKYAVLFHIMESYFQNKISTLSELEQEKIGQKPTPEKIGILIEAGLLPNNFKDFESELYDVTKNSYLDHIKERFLNESGKVDEERLIKHYESNKKAFYQEVLAGPEAQGKIDNILRRCDLQMGRFEEKESEKLQKSPSSSPAIADAVEMDNANQGGHHEI